MPEMMYKVLYQNYKKELESFADSDYCLYYKVGQVAKPEIGKLFVFDTLEHAKAFTGKDCLCYVIYKIEVTNPVPLKYVSFGLGKEFIEEFWKNPDAPYSISWADAPVGTYGVDSVKLIEQVWPE